MREGSISVMVGKNRTIDFSAVDVHAILKRLAPALQPARHSVERRGGGGKSLAREPPVVGWCALSCGEGQ